MCYIHCEPNLEHWDHPFERKRGLVIAIYPAIPYDIPPGELKQQFNLIPCIVVYAIKFASHKVQDTFDCHSNKLLSTTKTLYCTFQVV